RCPRERGSSRGRPDRVLRSPPFEPGTGLSGSTPHPPSFRRTHMPSLLSFRPPRALSFSMALSAVAMPALMPPRAADAPPARPPPRATGRELRVVVVGGNAESAIAGFRDKFVAPGGPKTSLEITASAVRVETTTKTVVPGTSVVNEETHTTASNKMILGRY